MRNDARRKPFDNFSKREMGDGMQCNHGIAQDVSGALLLFCAALSIAGCSKQTASEDGSRASETAPAANEKRYPLVGEIVSIDAKRNVLTVRHDAVEGLMPAMVMEFSVSAADAALARSGEHIRAELVLVAGEEPRLEKIWPDDRALTDAVAAGATALREDTHDRGTGAYREVGEKMPDFTLFDQSGRVVQSARFRGKQIMLNFIYTRCPDPNMCPLSTVKMTTAQRLAKEAGAANVEFVSITLDPTHDTPGVLKQYADVRGIDTSNYSFMTGPEGAIRDLLTQFGVIAQFNGDFIKHTLATLLIDADGKIIWRADGSAWEPSDFVARMHKGSPAQGAAPSR
jgi:protein SCO1/2